MSTIMSGLGTACVALSKVLSEKLKEDSLGKSVKRLLNIVEDVALIWNAEEACFVTQNIKDPDSPIQILRVNKPPVWRIEQIVANGCGTAVALVGLHGVGVVELPRRWGPKALYEGGKDSVNCRVEYVGERFFACHPRIEVVSAQWHPGSLDHSHMTILASDNYLRIYSLTACEIPEQAIPVGPSSSLLFSGVQSSGVNINDEKAVDFDFAAPMQPSQENPLKPTMSGIQTAQEMEEKIKEWQHFNLQWPIFILYANGEVYYTLTCLGPSRPIKRTVYGPLIMEPFSEDNYGHDACSLLVLTSAPPVLVIGNTSGKLHHCIVVNKSEDLSESETKSESTLSQLSSQLNLQSSNVSLHVYESIQLSLTLDADYTSNTCNLFLHHDPSTPTRYWASHELGVHGVAVPLVHYLNEFSNTPEETPFPNFEFECVVEHLVCTQTLPSAPVVPVVGIAGTVLPSALYVLLGMGTILKLPLPPVYNPQVKELQDNSLFDAVGDSPSRSVHPKAFIDYIRGALQRSSSQPLLASGASSNVSPQEYLTILLQVMETMRANYIQPQTIAREDIQRRVSILRSQKKVLEDEVGMLMSEKQALTDKAHEIAEKYEEANDKQRQIIGRLERAVGNLMRGLPILSAGERSMMKELELMKEQVAAFASQLRQVKAKQEWQQSQLDKHKVNEALRLERVSMLSDNQLKCIRSTLSNEGEKLMSLAQRINQVKRELQL